MRITLSLFAFVGVLLLTMYAGLHLTGGDSASPSLAAQMEAPRYALPAWLGYVPPVVLSFLFLTIVFRPLEWAFPAKEGQRFFRPNWFTDLCFFAGQYLVWNIAVLWVLMRFGGWLQVIVPASFRAAVAGQAWWAQAVELVLLSDFFVYWGHRLQHANGFLWRFHSIHHTAEHLDWLAAHREHPIDTIYTMGLINLPVFLLGFPAETLMGLILFRGIWAIYIHSNVRLPIGPVRWFIGAPELHHWHHDRDRRAGNYANISPMMDILFGTYRCPGHEPESFGVDEPCASNYVGHMVQPFLPKSAMTEIPVEPRGFPVLPLGTLQTKPATTAPAVSPSPVVARC